MRQRGAVIAKRLLDGPLDPKVLLQFSSGLLLEAKSEVDHGAALIGMTDVTPSPWAHSTFEDVSAKDVHCALVKRNDIAPHGRGFTHIRGDVTVQQEITNMGKVVFGRFK